MLNETNEYFAAYNGDCVEFAKNMPDNSVDFQVFSPPFANLYIYSDDLRDMGNCKDSEEFFTNFDFLIPELYRVLKPGRLAAVHCKQIAKYKSRDGASGWYDFRGDIIRHFESAGFQYHSEVVIWTDPVLEMQKTKTQRLLYCQLQRDASLTGIGMPEYLCIFRKWQSDDEDNEPIRHYRTNAEAVKDDGSELQVMDLDTWQRYASPVWFDIRRTDVLNARTARDSDDERHLCPLQLGTIHRAVRLWSNPGETVFSPFMGIGSEGYESVKLGRKFVGVELKESYYKQAVANLKKAVQSTKTLFDNVEEMEV
ncbi:MAG: DNA methyltransferase [Planctomycetia bacterium]|nr:DNA methyltransferase [Planctomycetia bacterium]